MEGAFEAHVGRAGNVLAPSALLVNSPPPADMSHLLGDHEWRHKHCMRMLVMNRQASPSAASATGSMTGCFHAANSAGATSSTYNHQQFSSCTIVEQPQRRKLHACTVRPAAISRLAGSARDMTGRSSCLEADTPTTSLRKV